MSSTLLLPLALFIFTMSVTPGPNNIMLASSGVNFGFRRTVPHILGISIGASLMLVVVGSGLGAVLLAWPAVQRYLPIVGAAYLLYLAWQIARAGMPDTARARPRPLSFWQSAAFQWVNPKAWVMVLAGASTYLPAQDRVAALPIAALVMCLVNLPSVSVWAYAGDRLRPWLRSPRAMRWFNLTMALLLVATLYPVLTTRLETALP